LVRAKQLLLRSTAYIISITINDLLSAAPILAAFGYLHQLLVPPSDHAIYHHCTRAGVRNYWHQGTAVLAAK
jgi:hypothetical protein